ncbi:MAG: DUF5677 domain-containing protein [Oceanicaulis sp.]
MRVLHDALTASIEEALQGSEDLDDEALAGFVEHMIKEASPAIEQGVRASLVREAPRMLKEHRSAESSFRKRNLARWKPALDLLEIIWRISCEFSESYANDRNERAHTESDYKHFALIELHTKSLLVTREIIALLECGYPDGALARWRTLHELSVVGSFIQQGDQDLAYRYLVSFDFAAQKAARQYEEYAHRAGLGPFGDEEMEALDQRCAELTRKLDDAPFKNDYDWARIIIDKPRPNLLDLEKATGLDHWRPRFRWASQHNHAGRRPADRFLGLAESENSYFLVGPSNSGFVDPLHMTAISLNTSTSSLILNDPNFDSNIVMNILHSFSDELGSIAVKEESETYRQAKNTE